VAHGVRPQAAVVEAGGGLSLPPRPAGGQGEDGGPPRGGGLLRSAEGGGRPAGRAALAAPEGGGRPPAPGGIEGAGRGDAAARGEKPRGTGTTRGSRSRRAGEERVARRHEPSRTSWIQMSPGTLGPPTVIARTGTDAAHSRP